MKELEGAWLAGHAAELAEVGLLGATLLARREPQVDPARLDAYLHLGLDGAVVLERSAGHLLAELFEASPHGEGHTATERSQGKTEFLQIIDQNRVRLNIEATRPALYPREFGCCEISQRIASTRVAQSPGD